LAHRYRAKPDLRYRTAKRRLTQCKMTRCPDSSVALRAAWSHRHPIRCSSPRRFRRRASPWRQWSPLR